MIDTAYAALLRACLAQPVRPDRTGVGTRAVFGHQLVVDAGAALPILRSKRVHAPSVLRELHWMALGRTDVGWLQDRRVSIWDEWARPDGSLGPIYGAQWRAVPCAVGGSVDQLATLVRDLVHTPTSRRLIVSAWNVAQLEEMALPPCHAFFQCHVSQGPGTPARLSLKLTQRSGDVFLGVPFNILSYAVLLRVLARMVGMVPGELIMSFGDLHLYANHEEQAREQLRRVDTLQDMPAAPATLVLGPAVDLRGAASQAPGPALVRAGSPLSQALTAALDLALAPARVDDYTHLGPLPAPVAV